MSIRWDLTGFADIAKGVGHALNAVNSVATALGARPEVPWEQVNEAAYKAALDAQDAKRMEEYMTKFIDSSQRLSPATGPRVHTAALEHLNRRTPWWDMLRDLHSRQLTTTSNASLNEAGYASVAATRSDSEMRKYIKHAIESHRWQVADEGGLSGFVPWYSGTQQIQSYARLQEELREVVNRGNGWIRKCEEPERPPQSLDSGSARFEGACTRCEGRGFIHESMPHDKPPNERCFFCKDCPGCGATGRAAGPPCSACHGRGWKHASSMSHQESEGMRCFFCEDCKQCRGKGHV